MPSSSRPTGLLPLRLRRKHQFEPGDQRVDALEARQRFCLTGTPVENHLGELWALMDFVNPGLLGDRRQLARAFRAPIEKNDEATRRQALARRVRPFLLRRTKAQVAAELPPKTEIIEHVEMEAAQSAIYEAVRLTMHRKVREAVAAKGLDRSHRIGQDKPVFVHRLVALNTIEEKMLELQRHKGALAEGLFDPEAGGPLDITVEDVELLLAGA